MPGCVIFPASCGREAAELFVGLLRAPEISPCFAGNFSANLAFRGGEMPGRNFARLLISDLGIPEPLGTNAARQEPL